MPRVLPFLLTLCLMLCLVPLADAKRLGGGKSYGSAPSHASTPMRRSDSQPAGAPASAPSSAPAAPGPSRWVGPLAGFAAGGLLASLFAGHDYAGPQWLDLLILGGLGFLVFRLLKSRKAAAPSASTPAYSAPIPSATPGPMSGSLGLPPAQPRVAAPAWFDQERFIAEGRRYFMEFQQYWDANEMQRLAEYFTPQMMTFLREERARLGDGYQSTYIDDLQVYLEGVDDLPDMTVATLTFMGVAKTSRFDAGEAFSESWRLERGKNGEQPWQVAGIRQNAN